jgi:hypothetical protein
VTRDRARDEAERLVAAAIAAVSLAARGMGASGRSGFATGSTECCICPVCRLIASMRDPNTDLAERLASGAGDLATGVASMLRALSRGGHGTSDRPRDNRRGRDADRGRDSDSREGDEFWESLRQRATEQARAWSGSSGYGGSRPTDVDDDESDVERDPWRTATSVGAPTPRATAPKPMAKKAIAQKAVAKKTVARKVTLPGASEPAAPPSGSVPPAARTAKKATPKKAVPTKSAPSQVTRSKTASKKAVPKKAVPRPEEFE